MIATSVEPERWLTLREAALHMKCHYETARLEANEYLRTGRSGLECYQRKAGACIRVPVSAADRWARGEAPKPVTRKLKRVG